MIGCGGSIIKKEMMIRVNIRIKGRVGSNDGVLNTCNAGCGGSRIKEKGSKDNGKGEKKGLGGKGCGMSFLCE
ncbi:hypothetical protein, partial [Staphylococcus epidermidis]|uniref:hypothetical protein n=1 Tax=Staphylococcus epidermidis TaxID=1282 RepID=UPI0011A14D8F